MDKISAANGQPEKKRHLPAREIAFDRPRDFLNNRFVYAVHLAAGARPVRWA